MTLLKIVAMRLVLTAAVLLVAICAGARDAEVGASRRRTELLDHRTPVLKKSANSSKLRLLFVVGLEGTGHHYIFEAMRQVLIRRSGIVLVSECDMAKPYYLVDGMADSPEKYAGSLAQARMHMRELARTANNSTTPGMGHIVTMQAINHLNRHGEMQSRKPKCFEVGGMLSYPNDPGREKALQYVDFALLAEVAEAEGVDLRVLYLRRSARSLMISNLVHSHYENELDGVEHRETNSKTRFMEYMRILFTDTAVVHSFLAEIDPAFVMCHDYDLAGDRDQAARVANFISPNSMVAKVLEDLLVLIASPKQSEDAVVAEELPFEGADVVALREQRKLDALEAPYCGVTA